MITAATSAEQYWHLHRSDCRNTLIYAHKILRKITNCDITVVSLNLPAPEAGDFEELLLLHKTADIRHAYHLSSTKHTAAVLKATIGDSARFFVWNICGSCVSVSLQFPSFARECFCSLRGYILCICKLEIEQHK
jgi:hypothetical protein